MRGSLAACAKPGMLFVSPSFLAGGDASFPRFDSDAEPVAADASPTMPVMAGPFESTHPTALTPPPFIEAHTASTDPVFVAAESPDLPSYTEKPAPVSRFSCDGVRNVISLSATPDETAMKIRTRIKETRDRYTEDELFNLEIGITEAAYDAATKLEAAADAHDVEFAGRTTPEKPGSPTTPKALDAAGIQAYFANLRTVPASAQAAKAAPQHTRIAVNADTLKAEQAAKEQRRLEAEAVATKAKADRLARAAEQQAKRNDPTFGAMRRVEAPPKKDKSGSKPNKGNHKNQGA